MRLHRQSTLETRSDAAISISADVFIPVSTISKSYLSASFLYSSMVLHEFASLVVYRIPIYFAYGIICLIILSCSSTGSTSDEPVIFPTLEPSSLARPATTGSETAVYTIGMSAFIAEL